MPHYILLGCWSQTTLDSEILPRVRVQLTYYHIIRAQDRRYLFSTAQNAALMPGTGKLNEPQLVYGGSTATGSLIIVGTKLLAAWRR